ncbi:hypothetical protein V6N13_051191 [Hibiscus sabdariffa]
MIECSVCHSKIASPTTKSISRAYDKHHTSVSSKTRFVNVILVGGDCLLVGLQVLLTLSSLTNLEYADPKFVGIKIGLVLASLAYNDELLSYSSAVQEVCKLFCMAVMSIRTLID